MRTDAMIKSEGMKILSANLGLVEAERFIFLMNAGNFDYTEWQRSLFEDLSLDELSAKAMKHWNNTHNES